MQIQDRTFIITGGASGLGGATAQMLVENGASVVLADLNREAGEVHASELGANARFVAADVTKETDGASVIAAALDSFGFLHGLVNCAGVVVGEKILGRNGPHALESFARVVNVNLIGTFNMIRLAAEAIARGEPDSGGERGVIVNAASIAAFDGQIGQAAYAASKGAVASLTLPAAREFARLGIRVVTIAPGIFETPMMSGLPQDVQGALGAGVPFPSRLGRPTEYAFLVRHIIENTMLNGEVIRLDGALRMPPG